MELREVEPCFMDLVVIFHLHHVINTSEGNERRSRTGVCCVGYEIIGANVTLHIIVVRIRLIHHLWYHVRLNSMFFQVFFPFPRPLIAIIHLRCVHRTSPSSLFQLMTTGH